MALRQPRETQLMKEIQVDAVAGGGRFFRNNTAMGWAGDMERAQVNVSRIIRPQDVVVRNAKPLHAGLCKGSSDLIGWKPVVITADMVGKTLAVFCALEVKRPTERPTKEQLAFLDAVIDAGGLGGIVHSKDEARQAIYL